VAGRSTRSLAVIVEMGCQMKQRSIVAIVALASCAAFAEEQPPVRFVVEMREAGKIVECPSATGVLGQIVRVSLSGGRRVVSAIAKPMDAEGRSKVTVRFESPPLSPGGLEAAYEMTNTFNLSQSSPTFRYGPEGPAKTSFTVLVRSPPLLATTRAEPSWQQHLSKLASEPSSTTAECKPLLGLNQ
jgi:hypothetical protein